LAQVDWFWAMGCSKMTLRPSSLALGLKAFLASVAVLVVWGLMKANYEKFEGAEQAHNEKIQALERALAKDEEKIAGLEAALAPRLEVTFDRGCEECSAESGRQFCLGVWNKGLTVDDVHVYLQSLEPGPRYGKLEFSWLGEGRQGRTINGNASASDHHHFVFLISGQTGPFSIAVGGEPVLDEPNVYTVRISVEGKCIKPSVAEVVLDSGAEPPILALSPGA